MRKTKKNFRIENEKQEIIKLSSTKSKTEKIVIDGQFTQLII